MFTGRQQPQAKPAAVPSRGCIDILATAIASVALCLAACSDARCPSGTTEMNGRCRPTDRSAGDTADDLAPGTAGAGGMSVDPSSEAPKRGGATASSAGSGGTGGQTGDGEAPGPETAGRDGSAGVSGATAGNSASPQSAAGGDADEPALEPRCGNGVREGRELCDGTDCVLSCETSNKCLVVTLEGSNETCDARCSKPMEIRECKDGDGCCAEECNFQNDDDCSSSCGDGIVDATELCEPTSSDKPCSITCVDADPCTTDIRTGTPDSCNVACAHTPMPRLGPESCDDGDPCTRDTRIESATVCATECRNAPINRTGPTACDDGDPCTRDTLNASPTTCTNECDHQPMARSGPSQCNDDDPCTRDMRVESATECSAECKYEMMPRTGPSECDDGDPCTRDMRLESQTSCTAECRNETLSDGTRCNENGTCSNGVCEYCGDGYIKNGEECDPRAAVWTSATCGPDCKRSVYVECDFPYNTTQEFGQVAACGQDGWCVGLGNYCSPRCFDAGDCPNIPGPGSFCSRGTSGDGVCFLRCNSLNDCPEGFTHCDNTVRLGGAENYCRRARPGEPGTE